MQLTTTVTCPTFKAAKATLKALGMFLTKLDNEYYVNFSGSIDHTTAYYTDDLLDAYQTGIAMFHEGLRQAFKA